jgi:phosphotransferase system  glucose/maltose/N-acetylglucosamine-specific IIC component
MQKIIKNKAGFFICNFLGFLAFIILSFKFFDIKGMGTFSWREIGHSLYLYVIGAFLFAVIMYIKYYNAKNR